jgi:hypothetical protein
MNEEKCPICGADAKKFPSTGDFHGFDCPTHGQFEVSGPRCRCEHGMRAKAYWRGRLDRAKLRTESGKRPRILDDDFF